MSAIGVLSSALRMDFLRYRRSAALLYVALATPIAAHFMVPVTESAYSVLLVNGAAPVLTPAVLGFELGMITATVLTPMAYIFLRAGPTRRRPWQVTDTLAHSRVAMTLGQWAADSAALWLLLVGLTLAGAILMFLRAGAQVLSLVPDFASMAACLWLTAGPAMALTAAVRTLLAALPFTRGWGGDVAFFFYWMFSLALPVVLVATSGAIATPSPLLDPFGMIYPVVKAVDVPVIDLTIGGGPPTAEVIAFDALAGTLSVAFIASRVAWLGLAASVALVAGLLAAPQRVRAGTDAPASPGPISTQQIAYAPACAATLIPVHLLSSHWRLLLRPTWYAAALIAVALGGWVLPYREVVGPTLLLLTIFPISAAAARWEGGDLPPFLDTTLVAAQGGRISFLLAALLLGGVLQLPALLSAVATGSARLLPHMAGIAIGVAVFSLLGAVLTRGAVAARLLLLIAWYAYFASA
ncbi:MAG: hypothetical protein AAF184_00085 [Pseudomonadota bacterium]